MQEWLLFPVLEIILPIIDALMLPRWLIAVIGYFGGALLPTLLVVGIRWFKGIPLKWYEGVTWVALGLVWGLVILTTPFQVILTGWSFYLGLLACSLFFWGMFQDYLKDEEIKLMFAFTAVALFIIPLLLAGFVSPAEFGQQVSWGQYFNDPSRMIGRF
jgi:hypothetical protein